ncbi:uncharacterized protein LOC135492702 isoform X2 [Lineus longissimus]|uniref:uncharacterized protein LOC135492702 isoform X2 n=1 Tax=Lineus longissimus TaxID=88925 RepID=UPI00315C742D
MVSAAAQIISTLVPFFLVIVTLTLGLYFLFNPKKRPHCCCSSNKVEPESNSDVTDKLPDEQKTERKDTNTDDITAPPTKLHRKKSVAFNITRSIIFMPPPSAKIETVGVSGSSVVSASSLGSHTGSSVSSDTDSSAGSSVCMLPRTEDKIRKSVPNTAETTQVQVVQSQPSQTSLEEREPRPSPQKPDAEEKATYTPVTNPLFSSSSSFSELSFTSTSDSSSDSDAESDSETSTCTDSSSDSSCSSTGSGTSSNSLVKAATNVDFPGVDDEGHTKEKLDTVFVRVDSNQDVEKPKSRSEQNQKSVHVKIEPGNAECEDLPGHAGLISIRVEGPSTSSHLLCPVEPSLPSFYKLAGESDKSTASSGNQEKILLVYSTEPETVDHQEAAEENFAPLSDERELITEVETSCAGIKFGVSPLPEIEPGVVSDPFVIEADSSHFKAEERTTGVTVGDDLAFGEEDTISAIIELYEKTLDLTIGETTVHVDERNSSPGSGELSLPETKVEKDSLESPPHGLEAEELLCSNAEQEGPEATDTFDQSSSLVSSAELPQVSSLNKDKEEETDMATTHFQAGMYENIAKLGRLNSNGDESLDSKPVVMPPLRLHGVVIPDVSQKRPDSTPEKTSEPDIKVAQLGKAPVSPALPKFRQLSINSPEKRSPTFDSDSKPADNSMNVKMRTITVPGLPSGAENMVPVRPVAANDSDADGSYVEPSTVHSEGPLLRRPTTAQVKLMMMEEDKMKSRKSWEKNLLSGSEGEKKPDVSPQPPPQHTKHKCRHHHHHRRRRSTGDKNHCRDSKNSQESSVLSEEEMMLKRLGRNMRARDRRLNAPLNPMEKEASARSQDLLQLLTQSQKITADKPVILFTRTHAVDEDREDANTIVSDSAQPMAMSTVDKINSNSRKHRRGRGRHRMPTLKTPFDKPIPEASGGNNNMDSHRSEISVMSDSAVDRLISDGTLVRTKADLALPQNVRRNIVCPSI